MRKLIPLVSVCALMWSAPINASPPERFTFGPWNFSGFFITECIGGYDVLWDFTYYGEFFVYYDKEGFPDRVFYKQRYPGSYYNSVFPDVRVYQNKSTGDQRWIDVEDGLEVRVNTRVHTILTVPGYGIIEQDVGRIEVDLITGEITFDARDYSFDLDALCAALAP